MDSLRWILDGALFKLREDACSKHAVKTLGRVVDLWHEWAQMPSIRVTVKERLLQEAHTWACTRLMRDCDTCFACHCSRMHERNHVIRYELFPDLCASTYWCIEEFGVRP